MYRCSEVAERASLLIDGELGFLPRLNIRLHLALCRGCRAFIEQMIPHHQMAVMMTSHMGQGVEQPELKALMETMATSQTAEINQMREWYASWYGAQVPAWGPGRWGNPPTPDNRPGPGPRQGPGAGQGPRWGN